MVMNWNDKADAKLFMQVLKIHNVKLNYVALAAAMGENVTAKAITHRISRLRSMAEEEPADGESSATGASPAKAKRTRNTKAAPGTSKKAPTSTAAGGPKGRGRKPTVVFKSEKPYGLGSDDDYDDDDEKPTIKEEEEEEEDAEDTLNEDGDSDDGERGRKRFRTDEEEE